MARPKSLLRMVLEPIVIAIGLAVLVRAAVHIYSIPSASMAPTLRSGDRIVVTRYATGSPQRGDIVVFQSLTDRSELMVKRVIGVPGDLVDSRLGRVRVGGYTLPEQYVLRQAATGAIESQVIPADSFFVLGDNRDNSIDSRSWGVVPAELIVGRARMILWSSPGSVRDPVQASTAGGEAHAQRTPRSARIFKWLR